MMNVPDAWWIGQGLPEMSPYEAELQNELDTLKLELREADHMLYLADDDKVPALELRMAEIEERINTTSRELRYLRYYA